MTAVRAIGAAAAAVAPFAALMWIVAAIVALTSDGYHPASQWLLLVNQLVLVPVLAGAAWWLGRLVAGRVGGVTFPLAVAVVPTLGVLYANEKFRGTYTDVVLTEAVGIADGGHFAAGALLLLATALLASVSRRERIDWVLAAGGAVLILAVLGAAAARGELALDVSWAGFQANMAGLREFTWSNRLLQWLPLAGVIGLARCSRPAALLVGLWFGAFAVARGASPELDVGDGSFLASFVPVLPAFSLLTASLPLLFPGAPDRLRVNPWTRARSSRSTPASAGQPDQ